MPTNKLPFEAVKAAYQQEDKPERKKLGLKAWSQLANEITGTNLYDAGIDANILQRGVSAVEEPFEDAASSTGEAITNALGDNLLGRSLSTGAEFLVGSVPTMGLTMATMASPSKRARLLKSMGLLAPFGFTSTFNRTADVPASAVSAATLGAAPTGIGAAVNSAKTPLGKAGAGLATEFGLDLTEIAGMPTGDPSDSLADRPAKNLSKFFSDPANPIGLALAEVPFGLSGHILERAKKRKEARDETVRQQPGLISQEGTAENLKQTLRDSFGMDIPDQTNNVVIRNAANTAKSGNVEKAQQNIFASLRDQNVLTEQQQKRLKELDKSFDQRLGEFSETVERDLGSEEKHVDEIKFTFKDQREATEFLAKNINEFGREANKMRAVGNNLFYWGNDFAVLSKFSESARKGEAAKFSVKRGDNLFANPVVEAVQKALSPKAVSGGRKIKGAAIKSDKDRKVKTSAIIRELEKRFSKDITEYYRQEYKKFEDASGRIDRNEVFQITDKIIPELEVRKLDPKDIEVEVFTDKAKEAKEFLESKGYSLKRDDDMLGLFDDDVIVNITEKPDSVQDAFETILREGFEFSSDAATGRHGIEPIPVSKMDRPVDLLVKQKGDTVFESDHFGRSDENVIASVRGYFTDPKTFFAYEVQSDFASKVKKNETTSDSIHLRNYESLGLQAVIQHAKQQGATRIVLPDAETAMKIQGHDFNVGFTDKSKSDLMGQEVTFTTTAGEVLTGRIKKAKVLDDIIAFDIKVGDKTYGSVFRVSLTEESRKKVDKLIDTVIPEERGMRFHYSLDGSLHNNIKKLGVKPVGNIDLGKIDAPISRLSNLKDNIIGALYDISQVNPEDFTLFKLEQLQKATEEKVLLDSETLTKLTELQNEKAANGQLMSVRDFVQQMRESDKDGSNWDPVIALRAMAKVGSVEDVITAFKDQQGFEGQTIGGFTTPEGRVAVNTFQDNRASVIDAAHEMTHSSLHHLKKADPLKYNNFVAEITSLPVENFRQMLLEASSKYGLNIDVDYASGLRFDQNSSNWSQLVGEERAAAVSEIVMAEALQAKRSKLLDFLPFEVQDIIRKVIDKLRLWFNSPFRYGNLLSKDAKATFDDAYSIVERQVFENQKAARRISAMFDSAEGFNPELLGSDQLRKIARHGFTSNFKMTQEQVEGLTFMDRPGMTTMQKNFWSNLALTKAFPIARQLFESLHNYRPNIQKTMMQYFSELGQNDEGNLPHDTALNAWQDWVDRTSTQPDQLERIGKVFQEQQNRRRGEEALPGEENQSGVLSEEEMVNSFGLTEENAKMVSRFNRLVQRVAFQEFLDMSHRDYLNTARFLLTNFNESLSKADAEELGRQAVQLSNEASKALVEASRAENKADKLAAERQAAVLKNQLKQKLQEELANKGIELSADSKQLNALVELVTIQAKYRLNHVMSTQKEGYAPQVRQGNWILRYETPEGDEQVEGFNTEKEAVERFKKLKEGGVDTGRISEKSKLDNFYRHYTSNTIQELRNQTKKELNSALSSLDQNDEKVVAVVDEIKDSYSEGSMETELSDAIGTKADPFRLKRRDVGGFNSNEYLPNLLDYINIKTIIGQKGITSARAKLEMSQPEFFKNKDLVEHFRDTTDYTLNANHNEWSPIRKFVYDYFLGFSMRHYFQNITQPFIIGVPELAAQTGDMMGAPGRLMNAYKQVRQWNKEGTTGNKQLDKVMKQGEDEQLWNPSMLRQYVANQNLEVGVESTTSFLRGTKGFGQKASLQAKRAARKFQEGMQVTAEASEIFNRQVSFAMRINKELGQKVDQQKLEELYTEGKRFTNDVNFVGDKSNRPGFIRKSGIVHGPLMATTSLMSFVINHLSLIASYAHQVRKGSVDPKTYVQRPDKFKFDNPGMYGLMMSTATLVGMAGAMGLPFTQEIDALFEKIWGIKLSDAIRKKILDLSEHINMEEEEGDVFADAIMTGLPGAMGINASQSVGLGRVFSFQAGRPFTFFDLAGAFGGIAERGLKGVEAIRQDPSDMENWQRAYRKSAPVGLQYWHELSNVMKNNKGVDTEGRIVTNELDPGASISRLLGFTPTEVSKSRSSEFRARRIKDRLRQERIDKGQQVGRLIFEYQRTEDPAKLQKAREVYNNFVSKQKLTLSERESLLESITTDVFSRSDQRINIPNERMREALASVQEANPEFQPQVESKLGNRFKKAEVGQLLRDPAGVTSMFMDQSTFGRYIMYQRFVESGMDPTMAWNLANMNVDKVNRMRGTPGVNVRTAPISP